MSSVPPALQRPAIDQDLLRHAITLRTHRTCAPEHRTIVLRTCLRDRSVLPRWHQDDRGPVNRGRGYHVEAPAGAYSHIVVWDSQVDWVERVVPAVVAQNEALRKRMHLSVELLLNWGRVKSGYADPQTGRRCIVRPSIIASVLGVTERQVQAANAFARKVGLEHRVMTGRMLTLEESTACRARGSSQRGLSSEVALTIPDSCPPPAPKTHASFTPTRGRNLNLKTNVKHGFLHGQTAAKTEPAKPAPRNQDPGGVRRMANSLIALIPWLKGEQPGRLIPALTRFHDRGWTAEDLKNALDDSDRRRQIAAPQSATIRTRPAVVLAALLRHLDSDTDQPSHHFSHPPLPRPTCPECDEGWVYVDIPGGHEAVKRCGHCYEPPF